MKDKDVGRLGLSIKEAISITGLGRTTLWNAIRKGKLRCFKIGRRVLFSPDHLQEFLQAHESGGTKPSRTTTNRTR